jgi:hypothetical protein
MRYERSREAREIEMSGPPAPYQGEPITVGAGCLALLGVGLFVALGAAAYGIWSLINA